MVIGSHLRRKATSSSQKVYHSGTRLNRSGHKSIFREALGPTAVESRKSITNAAIISHFLGMIQPDFFYD